MTKSIVLLSLLLLSSLGYSQSKIVCADRYEWRFDDIKTFVDHYKEEVKQQESTITMSLLAYKNFFNSSHPNFKKILLNIEIVTDGSYIITKAENYKPQDNEILFLLENEDRYGSEQQQLKFRLGSEIKKAVLSKDLDPMLILEFLKCKAIKLKIVPKDDYFTEAFENAMNK